MKTKMGEEAAGNSHKAPFATRIECHCGGAAWLAFVASEGLKGDSCYQPLVMSLYDSHKDGCWPDQHVAVAVYFCRECGDALAAWNQGPRK